MTRRFFFPFSRSRWSALREDRSGLALVEFAFSLPILMTLMALGLEMANYVIATKRIGDLAVLVADNASRMGQRGELSVTQISEAEINDVFIGSSLQSGALDIGKRGRIILSSLQQNADGGQWIAWQRCYGELGHGSSYGLEGDGKTGTSLQGMGPEGRMIQASSGNAVMVVEIAYQYERLVPVTNLPFGVVTEIAAFNVREPRDLTTINNPEGVEVSNCD